MGVRIVSILLVLGSLWTLFTTFRGVSDYFDLPVDPKINPAQFAFGLMVTLVVFGFVVATQLIWNLKADDVPALVLKAAWAVCVLIELLTSFEGTTRYVFQGDDSDAIRGVGLAVVTALVVSSTMFLSRLLLAKPGGSDAGSPTASGPS
jgi:tryptophan-rich sensory protein